MTEKHVSYELGSILNEPQVSSTLCLPARPLSHIPRPATCYVGKGVLDAIGVFYRYQDCTRREEMGICSDKYRNVQLVFHYTIWKSLAFSLVFINTNSE